MKTNLTKLAPSKFQLDVEVDEASWAKAREKAFKKLAARVSIPGFRPGKAPEAMLRAHVDPNRVVNEALDIILPEAYQSAITETKLRPQRQPDVNLTKVEEKEIGLRFTVITFPEIELGAYKGLTAERKVASVEEKEVDESIAKLLQNNADLVVTEEPAKLGDTVVLDFEGFIDGVAFEGGKAENHSLELGSNSFIPGFEDALVGVKAGEARDVKVTFPTQYVAELAGKDAVFACKVHEVKQKVVPALTDEAVADLAIDGVKTVDELKAHQKEELLKQKADQFEREHYQAIFDQIVAASKVEIAEEILDEEVAREEDNTKKQVESNGLTFQQYLDVLGKKEEELKTEIRQNVTKSLTAYLVGQEISVKEKLLVSDAELDVELAKVAEQYKMPVEQVRSLYGSNLESFRESLRQKKLQDFLIANNK